MVRFRPAQKNLVGHEVRLPEVSEVIQLEPRRVPVEVIGQPQAARSERPNRTEPPWPEREVAPRPRRGGWRRVAGSSEPRWSAGREWLGGRRDLAEDCRRVEHPGAVRVVLHEVDARPSGRWTAETGVADRKSFGAFP